MGFNHPCLGLWSESLADIGECAVGRHDEWDAVGERYLPIEGVAPLSRQEYISLVKER